jgi:hypothetical protein
MSSHDDDEDDIDGRPRRRRRCDEIFDRPPQTSNSTLIVILVVGGPMPAVGLPTRNVVLVLMADGSVKSVSKDRLGPDLLRGLITPAAKEQIPGDW